ncbi:HutD family protein [Agrobacterium vitis]|uniref:HutD family protein n=1 Tax=Agrobacterium vitis TaxID=373 RepID=UPI001571B537|nr:HutD family protein [Agrobacterium vitis]NSZ55141.1 HutD family protein [Agrobacterium vitis]NTA34133.1 HutD family protein [Agrobacterium vitis]
MQILRREDYRRMPWKNGQGMTEEILIFPPDSGLGDFDYRLSIAHVGANGPFSTFPGVDRSIALLDGDGMVLSLPDGQDVTLKQGSEPLAFSGDWAVSSRNLGSKTIDLNIMTRRGHFRHTMQRDHLKVPHGQVITTTITTLAVFNSDATVIANGQTISLRRFDTLVFSPGDPLDLTLTGQCDLLTVTLDAGYQT